MIVLVINSTVNQWFSIGFTWFQDPDFTSISNKTVLNINMICIVILNYFSFIKRLRNLHLLFLIVSSISLVSCSQQPIIRWPVENLCFMPLDKGTCEITKYSFPVTCQGVWWQSWTPSRTPSGLSPSPGDWSPVRPRTFWTSLLHPVGQICWLCAAPVTLCTCTAEKRSAWWESSRVTRLLCVGCVSLICPLTCCSPAPPMGHCGAGTSDSPVLMPPRCFAVIRHIRTARLTWAAVTVCCAQAQSR